MSVLCLKKVTAGYGPIDVLHDLSLGVAEREIVVILGANGSGKSTALKTAIGLTKLREGTVEFGGKDISKMPAHKRAIFGIGYVPQTQNIFSDLTVMDNLRMGGYVHHNQFERNLVGVFDLFPRLKERCKERAGSLSGGERRMLSIGLTLLLKPRILLLDEPSSDLAPSMVDQVMETIVNIYHEWSIPILMVEQNVAKSLEIAQRIYVFVRGRNGLEANAEDVKPEELRQLFLEGTRETQ
jgi:ABC-type branched-subunit amino acid transport system ATPase component